MFDRRKLYSNFSYNKWNQLDIDTKWKYLQELENILRQNRDGQQLRF